MCPLGNVDITHFPALEPGTDTARKLTEQETGFVANHVFAAVPSRDFAMSHAPSAADGPSEIRMCPDFCAAFFWQNRPKCKRRSFQSIAY